MAEIEVNIAENVMEACARTPSIKRCVFTSSLAACIWQDNVNSNLTPIINHDSWSSESLCIDKKVNFLNIYLHIIYFILYFLFVLYNMFM
jgi:nucleoside-diphosphate-sugar epimerase